MNKRLATIALAGVAALALAGCGGGGVAGNTTDSSTEGSATGGVYKLGLAAPFSGSEAMFGDYMKYAAELAANEINEAGGVLGHTIEIVTEDDACDATQAAAAANKLVEAGVVASVGGYCSGATQPTIPIFYNAKIPQLISVANSDNLIKDNTGNVWLLDGTGSQQAATALKYVQKEGYKKLVVIDDKTDYSANLAQVFAKIAKEAGLDVTTDSLTPKETDFSAQVAKIKKGDFFYFTGYVQEAGLLVKQAVEGGYTGGILLGDGSVDKKVAEIAGLENVKNVRATFTKTPDMLDDGGAFAEKYKALAGKDPGPYTIHSYDTVKTWAAAATAAGSVDMEAVDNALKTIKLDGLTGEISFEADGSRTGTGGFVIVKPDSTGAFVFDQNVE